MRSSKHIVLSFLTVWGVECVMLYFIIMYKGLAHKCLLSQNALKSLNALNGLHYMHRINLIEYGISNRLIIWLRAYFNT